MKIEMDDSASRFVSDRRAAPSRTAMSGFARDVQSGLARRPRSIPSKYFYDTAGSILFDRICELPEYYPTRTEVGMLTDNAVEIAEHIGANPELIEFGAGSLTKVRLLLDALDARNTTMRYVPIDVSGEHLERAANFLRADYPLLDVQPLTADYTTLLALPKTTTKESRRVGFFPGSTIGNFQPDDAQMFLRLAARLLRGGGMLIGVDLVKDPARLHAAYNDAQGVTAQFNLNLLHRANRELGTNFDPQSFAHYAFYNPVLRRIEMHLLSRKAQTVDVLGTPYPFEQGDTIHTENSYKYTVEGFRELAAKSGFRPGRVWIHDDQLFSLHWLHAPTD